MADATCGRLFLRSILKSLRKHPRRRSTQPGRPSAPELAVAFDGRRGNGLRYEGVCVFSTWPRLRLFNRGPSISSSRHCPCPRPAAFQLRALAETRPVSATSLFPMRLMQPGGGDRDRDHSRRLPRPPSTSPSAAPYPRGRVDRVSSGARFSTRRLPHGGAWDTDSVAGRRGPWPLLPGARSSPPIIIVWSPPETWPVSATSLHRSGSEWPARLA
jgi:hypothetical protein